MKSARDLVEPGDLIVVNYRRCLAAGVAKRWTDNDTFQFFQFTDYKHRMWGPDTADELEDYLSDDPSFYTSYITARIEQRVAPITEQCLNDVEQRYYEIFKAQTGTN